MVQKVQRMMNNNDLFKPEKTHLLCHIGDDCYKLEQFNTESRQEWITRLFFDEICSEWDIDFIINSVISESFFNENVVHKLRIPLNDAIGILIKHKVADEIKHADLMIEFLIQNKIYVIENRQLFFFNDVTIFSESYLHCMTAYLNSMMYKLKQLKKSMKSIENEVISNQDIGTRQTEFKKTTEECITLLNRAFENGLNPHEIFEMITIFKNFMNLNKLIYLNKSNKNIIKINKYQFSDIDEKIDLAIALMKEMKQSINLIKKCATPEFKMALKLIDIEPTINLSV